MNAAMSDLFSSLSSRQPGSECVSTSFILESCSQDPNLTLATPAGYPLDSPPLYSIAQVKGAKPDILLFRGQNHYNNIIGDVLLPQMSSTTKMSLRGQGMSLKMSQSSGNFSLECPMGIFKWKTNQWTGSGLSLYDSSGSKIARHSKKRLEVYVPCSEAFTELVLLSATAANAMNESMAEAVVEVASNLIS